MDESDDHESNIREEIEQIVCQGTPEELENFLRRQSSPEILLSETFRIDQAHRGSLLVLAAFLGQARKVDILLSFIPDIEENFENFVFSHRKWSSRKFKSYWIQLLLSTEHYKILSHLIELGRKHIDKNYFQQVLLTLINTERIDSIKFLLENEYVNLLELDVTEEYSPLIFAVVEKGKKEILEYFLSKRSNLDLQNSDGETLVHVAITNRFHHLAEYLCELGAPIAISDDKKFRPFSVAAKNGDLIALTILFEYTKDPMFPDQLEILVALLILKIEQDEAETLQFINKLMSRAFRIRDQLNLEKIVNPPIPAYELKRETFSFDEFLQIQTDRDRLNIEALLILERMSKSENYSLLFQPLLNRAVQLIQQNRFDSAFELMIHTFYLYEDVGQPTKLHRFVWLCCRILSVGQKIPVENFLKMSSLLFQPSQINNKQTDAIGNQVLFASISVKILREETTTNEERLKILQWIRRLWKEKFVDEAGSTMLHYAVDGRLSREINYRSRDIQPIFSFPEINLIKVFLHHYIEYIDVNARTNQDKTPLHVLMETCDIARNADSFEIVQMLLKAGAHCDVPERRGSKPFDHIQIETVFRNAAIQPDIHKLKCICARYINENTRDYKSIVPGKSKLEHFLSLHYPASKFRRYSDSD